MPPSSSCSLTKRGGRRLGDPRPVACEPVKNTPSTGCSSSAAPTSPAPTTATNTLGGTPASCSSSAMCQAGQRRVLGRLVEHRVAGEQRRHEHVAADEVRVVPGRDVGHHAERLVAIRSRMPPSSNTVSAAMARAVSARKKSMPRSRPLSSLRDWRIGLPISRVSVAASCLQLAHHAVAEAAMQALRSRQRRAAQAGCAARARCALAATVAASSAGSVGDQVPRGGVVDLQRCSCCAGGGARPAGSRAAAACRRASPSSGPVELGVPLHGGHPRARRCGGSPRSRRRRRHAPRPRSRARASLMPWWCTLLTRGVPAPAIERREPRAGTMSTSWKLRS